MSIWDDFDLVVVPDTVLEEETLEEEVELVAVEDEESVETLLLTVLPFNDWTALNVLLKPVS